MIYDACHDQGSSRIEHTDLCRPLHRMGFSCSGSQCADAWHVKADGKDKGESFCFCEIGGQYRGDIRCISGSLCTEGGAYEASAGAIKGIEDTQQGFLGNRDCQGSGVPDPGGSFQKVYGKGAGREVWHQREQL